MTSPCADLDAYLDELLPSEAREQFERHLLGCAICQAAAEDFMQLLAAGAELSQHADRPRLVPVLVVSAPEAAMPVAPVPVDAAPMGAISIKAPTRQARSRWRPGYWWIAASGTAMSLAAALVFWLVHQPAPEDRIDGQIAMSLARHRSVDARLPYAPLDRYRPRDVDRGEGVSESISNKLIAEVEDHRPKSKLVAVYLASGDLTRADKALGGADHDDGLQDDDLEIDRAILALVRKDYGKALRYLDEVLARSPRNSVALWNRAIALIGLGLPLAAAEAFEDVAKLGESGWNFEATVRAIKLRQAEMLRSHRWDAGKAACEHLSPAHLPDPTVIRDSVSVCRPAFYEAVRVASRDDALALLPLAEELDRIAGNEAARSLVREVAKADPVQRQRAVATFARLTKTPDLPVEEKRRLLDQLRASGQNDLVLGALRRANLPGWRDEYVERATVSKDPFIAELGAERNARVLFDSGDPLGAEVELVRAVRECSKTDVELRCSYLHQALAEVYAKMNRPSDEREVAQKGLDRSRRLGLYWDEKLLFDYLAEAARSEGAHALMRAYLREAALRLGGCEQAQYAQETLAMASIDALHFQQARNELRLSPACDSVPSADRARVVAELAHVDGTAEEAAALREGLVRARAQPDQSSGQLAYLEALEGRLVAARDLGAARPLLQHAIEVADGLGRSDMDGMMARADAYASLLALAANDGDRAATLALFAKAAGAPLRGPCVVGVMIDAERVLVVTRDRTGKIEQSFDPKGRRKPKLDAASLIPEPLVHALSTCDRIDVLALPPVFGLPKLLPADLAWSYRGRSLSPEAPLSNPPHVVTVADTMPPRELDLPTLQALTLTPIPGASHVDLRGAEATPREALRSFAGADVVEIHAHGFIDLKRSDASLIALSPQADGHFALSAREIAGLKLPKAPLVVLATCHAAYTAPYRHEPWGLPHAFLLAGARAVLASPEKISDAEAGGFFRDVERRILGGADPAIALRDVRALQLARDPSSWTRDVLLFD